MKITKETRRQRALDIRALLARHQHKFTLFDACEKADINYKSTSNAISRLIKNNDVDAISNKRLEKLETAILDLADSKIESATV